MFQRLDQLRSGSLFIVTGQAGAGKSHLAASARRSGTVWVLDTEGAAQNLINKPGIHREIQAVQTLSLRQLLDAMREIKRSGRPGDTVILDSISKVLQAMRAYAQQRAGAETDRKSSLSYDEHASVNRNMQAIYTGLTELKHAGFHVIVIGHLAKKYQTNGTALSDVGLRVLADENISYEADAVLLVERNGAKRTVTPINKPPRQPHLQLNQEYPAVLATLYPDQAAPESAAIGSAPVAEASGKVTTFPTDDARGNGAPKTPREAERRFFARYGELIGGTTWEDVETFLGYPGDKPTTVQEWVELAAEVRAHSSDAENAAA
jgi:adenosyl cobinamide kinase/adenosyl cobinamide phosphate guanylyltransferase